VFIFTDGHRYVTGADKFYKSDKMTVAKVTFRNQYQMNVTGNGPDPQPFGGLSF